MLKFETMNSISTFTNHTTRLHHTIKKQIIIHKIRLHHTSQKQVIIHKIIKQTYKAKQKSARDTPGSWPAKIPKNPVVPTTVKRKAACTTKIYVIYMLDLEQT